MHFQTSLSLWELQVLKDLLCVRDAAEISSNNLLLLLIFKKIKFHLKPTVAEVSFLTTLHAWRHATFLWKQITALDMVLNTPVSPKLTITIQMSVKIQMIIEAVVQRCSVKKVFLEILQNSQESTCARASFLIKLHQACNFILKNDSGTGLFLRILWNL